MKSTETDAETDAAQPKPAIEEVFQQQESALLRYAYGYTKRREVAEEVVQEAFLKLHQHWQDVDSPRPWLYKAVRNIALNSLRKSKRETLIDGGTLMEDEISDNRPDSQIRRLEAVNTMRLLMANMGAKDRQLVKLKFEEDMSYSHIGKKLGMGVGNVGYRLHHILKSLAEGLRRKGIDGIEGDLTK